METGLNYLFAFWLMYACSQGIREAGVMAFGVAHEMKTRLKYNFHIFFNVSRAAVWLGCVLFMIYLDSGIWEILIRSVSLFMVFPFWHDGTYFQTRGWIDQVPDYWFFYSKSPTTTAKISLGLWGRSVLLLVGIFLYFWSGLVTEWLGRIF